MTIATVASPGSSFLTSRWSWGGLEHAMPVSMDETDIWRWARYVEENIHVEYLERYFPTQQLDLEGLSERACHRQLDMSLVWPGFEVSTSTRSLPCLPSKPSSTGSPPPAAKCLIPCPATPSRGHWVSGFFRLLISPGRPGNTVKMRGP